MTSEVTKCDSNAEKSSVAVVNDSLETILLGRRTHTCSIASGPSELGENGGTMTPKFGIVNRNQGPISVSVLEPVFFPKLRLFSNHFKFSHAFLLLTGI